MRIYVTTSKTALSRFVLKCVGLLAVISLLSACAKPIVRRYYTLALPPAPVPAEASQKEDLWVHDVTIAPIYNRPQIVYRYSPNELQFHSQQNWADRPQRMMTNLLVQAFATSGLFRSVSSRLGTSPPTYQLESTVLALEQLDGGDIWFAHVAMSLRLSRFDDSKVIWQYDFDERRPLNAQDVHLTVRAMSEIIEEQMKIVTPKIRRALEGGVDAQPAIRSDLAANSSAPSGTQKTSSTPLTPARARTSPSADGAESSGETGAGEETPQPGAVGDQQAASQADSQPSEPDTESVTNYWKQSAQYTSDTSDVRPGKGAIFLPALSDNPQREPKVDIYQGDEEITSGSMAQRISVISGTYQVHLGSGNLSQRTIRQVTVHEGEVTIVPPDWAALDVSVVDDKFIPFRGSYELVNMDNLEFYGIGYGADEELGEETQVWILPPGLYKLVKPGSTYRARTNFATVQLSPGAYVPFTLVMDTTTQDFLGAGVSETEMAGPQKDKKWTTRALVGGDMLLNQRSTGFSAQAGSSLAVNLFLDSLVKYHTGLHLWTTRLEIEEGSSIQSPTLEDGSPGKLKDGEVRSTRDRVYLNSIYIYELLPWMGPYARVRGETSLTKRYNYFETYQDVYLYDTNGLLQDVDRVLLADSFSPIELKQGLGVNFRLFHTTQLDLDLRMGIGARQYLAQGSKKIADPGSVDTSGLDIPDNAAILQMQADSKGLGPETAVLATARVSRSVQATTEFEALVHSGENQAGLLTQFSWRSSLSVQLGPFTSLIYSLYLDRDPDLRTDKPLATEHSIQLRFWYSPF